MRISDWSSDVCSSDLPSMSASAAASDSAAPLVGDSFGGFRFGYQERSPYLPFCSFTNMDVFLRSIVRSTTIPVASSLALDTKPPSLSASKISRAVAGASAPLALRISRYSRTAAPDRKSVVEGKRWVVRED